jgi:VanZ family protein
MPRVAQRAAVWLPPIALMGVIFAFSAMPSDDVERGLLHLLSRKAAHFGEYALLCALWWRALRTVWEHRHALAGALLICVAYAASDEYHQTFVDGRYGEPTDVLIDTAGALAAAALISLKRRREAVRA